MMGDKCYGQDPRVVACPYCEMPMECDTVDIGIGYQQCGPFHCYDCGASEIGPHDNASDLDADEQRTGFYKSRISPHANTVRGHLVNHHVALAAYRVGMLDKKPGES